MINIIVSGPPSSGKSWVTVAIRAALRAAGVGAMEMAGANDINPSMEERRMAQLIAGGTPLANVAVRITQVAEPSVPKAAPTVLEPSVIWLGAALTKGLEAALQDVDALIGATPSGDKRNAFTEANIHLMLAVDQLKKAQKL